MRVVGYELLFGDSVVPIFEQDYILLLGIVFNMRSIILLGLATKKMLLVLGFPKIRVSF